jgi:two-component system LytT family sensor kinase
MRLTALLRGVLKSEGDMTTLGQELDLIQAYLDVERARFEDRLDVRIVVPHVLRSVNMPPLLLQPIVENAVKHGVTPQRNGARIGISAEIEGGQLCVSVRDTGAGATESVLAHGRERGVGLRNVERRLVAQYGPAASLTVESAPGLGTLVEIRLPMAPAETSAASA